MELCECATSDCEKIEILTLKVTSSQKQVMKDLFEKEHWDFIEMKD